MKINPLGIINALLLSFLFVSPNFAANCTWLGAVSTDWNTPANWSCALVPGAADNVTFNNAAAPFMPSLNANHTVINFTVSAGTINVQGFALSASGISNLQNATVLSAGGSLTSPRIDQVSGMTFAGTIDLTKTGGTNNTWAGGNTFSGLTSITNNGTAHLTISGTNGNTFLTDVSFNNTSIDRNIFIATTGTSTFGGNVTLNNTSSGTFRFGNALNQSTIAAGGAILSGGFNTGTLNINNVLQNGIAPNGSFAPFAFTIDNTTLGGDFTSVTAVFGSSLAIQNSSLRGNTILEARTIPQISGNTFGSNNSNSLSITKGGGIDNNWNGGNTFNAVSTITNAGLAHLNLSNTLGSSFNANVTFNNSTTDRNFSVATNGTSTFAGNVTLNNSSTGTFTVGNTTNQSIIDTGGGGIPCGNA